MYGDCDGCQDGVGTRDAALAVWKLPALLDEKTVLDKLAFPKLNKSRINAFNYLYNTGNSIAIYNHSIIY